jgi:hypothetical protein
MGFAASHKNAVVKLPFNSKNRKEKILGKCHKKYWCWRFFNLAAARKKVENVYDAVRSSPAKLHPNLAQIESGILQSINALENTILTGNKEAIISSANSLLGAVNERNLKLKTLN